MYKYQCPYQHEDLPIQEDTEMILIHPWFYDAIVAGIWANTSSALSVYQMVFYNSSSADGDAVDYKAYLPAGTYKMVVLGWKDVNRGILKVKIDGVVVLTFDQYAAASSENERSVATEITIATEGIKTIQVLVDGKNPSSSAYLIAWQGIALWRTS